MIFITSHTTIITANTADINTTMGVAFSNTSCMALRWASSFISLFLMREYRMCTWRSVWRSVSSSVCIVD